MKTKSRGTALYGLYLGALVIIGYAVTEAVLAPAIGIALGIAAAAGMAIYWPRW